jgi:hypothetical protein
VDRERRIEPNGAGIDAQQARADGVGTGPANASTGAGRAIRCGNNALRPPLYLRRGSPGECEQEDAAWIGPVDNQMRDAVGQRIGLARSGPGDDQERSCDVGAVACNAVLNRSALLEIEGLQVGCFRHGGSFRTLHRRSLIMIPSEVPRVNGSMCNGLVR